MITPVNKPNSMTVAAWLEEKFKIWSEDRPRGERTLKAFADDLGVPYNTFFYYLNKGGKPEGENLKKIARKLGFEVYDILGMERPDARLDRFEEVWPTLSEAARKRLTDLLNEYVPKRHG